MADVQAPIVAPVPTNVNVYTASGPAEPAENLSPSAAMTSPAGITVVTSGTRPLLFASSASSVDGVVESTSVPTVQSTPPTPAQPAAAVTGIQINTAPSMNGGSGIVIKSAASSSPSATPASATSAPGEAGGAGQTIAQPATVTISPSNGSAGVSSGITIRSSASPTQVAPPSAPPSTSNQPGTNAGLSQSAVSSPVPIQPILINQVSQPPQQSAVAAPTPPVESPHPVQPPSGGTSGSVPPPAKDDAGHQPPAAVPSSGKVQQDGVIRAPAASSHGQKAVAENRRNEEPAITLSELVNRLDLVTVCGFLLAVLSVAFASILSGQDLSISWLMVIVAVASVVVFIRFRL